MATDIDGRNCATMGQRAKDRLVGGLSVARTGAERSLTDFRAAQVSGLRSGRRCIWSPLSPGVRRSARHPY
jgi:hypothetical protein